MLTHVDPVRIVSGMTAGQFSAEVLRTLLQIRSARTVLDLEGPSGVTRKRGRSRLEDTKALGHRGSPPPAPVPGSVASKDPEAFWRRLARIANGSRHFAQLLLSLLDARR